MANADYVLITRSQWDALPKANVSGNGLKQATSTLPTIARGAYVAIKVSDIQDVVLVDEGQDVSPAQVIEVPVYQPPAPADAVPSDSPAARE